MAEALAPKEKKEKKKKDKDTNLLIRIDESADGRPKGSLLQGVGSAAVPRGGSAVAARTERSGDIGASHGPSLEGSAVVVEPNPEVSAHAAGPLQTLRSDTGDKQRR